MSLKVGTLHAELKLDSEHFNTGLKSADSHMKGFASTMAGTMAGQVGFAVLAKGAEVLKDKISETLKGGIDFQDQLNTLKAVSSATAADMQKMSKAAFDLGNDITLPGVSAANAADAMVQLAKAGLSVNETLDATKGVLQLAAAGEISTAEAATYTADTLHAFNMKGAEAIDVADMLANAANASSAEVRDLGFSVQAGGAVYAAAGIPLKTFVAMVAEMANAGIKGSDAGTSLKTMLMALENPSKAAAADMQAMGVHIYDAHGKMRAFGDIIDDFAKSEAKMTEEQRNSTNATIFGSDAVRAANVIIGGGKGKLDEYTAAVTKKGGAAEVAAAKAQGLGGAVRGLQSQMETFQLGAFEKIAPALEAIVRWASDAMPKVQEFIEHLKAGYDPASALESLLKGLGLKTGELQQAMELAGPVIVNVKDAVVSTSKAIMEAWPTVEKLAKVFWEQLFPSLVIIAQHSDQLKPILLTLAATVGIVVGAIAAMIVINANIIASIMEFQDWVFGLGVKLGNLGGVLWGAGSALMEGFLNGLVHKWGEVKEFVGGVAQWVKDHKGPIEYDRALLIPHGRAVMAGFNEGLLSGWGDVQGTINGFTGALAMPAGGPSAGGGGGSATDRRLDQLTAAVERLTARDRSITNNVNVRTDADPDMIARRIAQQVARA